MEKERSTGSELAKEENREGREKHKGGKQDNKLQFFRYGCSDPELNQLCPHLLQLVRRKYSTILGEVK